MEDQKDKKQVALITLAVSAVFFIMGLFFPLLQTGYGIGPFTLQREYIYLASSFRFFFERNEIFIGALLLFFTIIFPVGKYIFLFLLLTGKKISPRISTLLELLNKWAMLDVFVVAVLLVNLKFDSVIIVSRLEHGTTLFALSIILLMTCSFLTQRMLAKQGITK